MPTINSYRDAVRHAALILWADAIWTDQAIRRFSELNNGESPIQTFGSPNIASWPMQEMDEMFIDEVSKILQDVETAWRRDLAEIAEKSGRPLAHLCSTIALFATGHGVSPLDDPEWPESLDCEMIPSAENPAWYYMDFTEEEWADECFTSEGSDIRSYSAQWGSGDPAGALFYNYASGHLDNAGQYDNLMDEISKGINFLLDNPAEDQGKDRKNLTHLYNFVLWERSNRFGRSADTRYTEKSFH